MRGLKATGWAAVLLAGGLLLAAPRPQRQGPLRLVSVPKAQTAVWDVLKSCGIDVRQELQTSFLAVADRGELAVLRSSRIRYSVLHRNAGERQYFLVPVSSPDVPERLRASGRVSVVEPETLVFWTEKGDPLDAIPPDLPRKQLSRRSILPYLRRVEPLASGTAFRQEKNPLIELIAGQVSKNSLRAFVLSLQDFGTRYASTVNCEAAGQAVFDYFQALGLDVRFQAFSFGAGYTSRNVIAEIEGGVYPEDILIVCGHYDSTSPAATRMTLAPGADDNASGTAAVMEAARVLASHPLDFTVRFIAFGAEEWGLYGSKAYAAEARTRNERIIGVLNLDMIAFADAAPEDLEAVVNAPSEWLAERLVLAAANYPGLVARKTVNASLTYSDHSPFWDAGYAALLAIEDWPLRNPYYHKTTDTWDTLDLDFLEDAAQAATALLAELAQPVRLGYPATPAGATADSFLYRSLFETVRNVRVSWSGRPDAVAYRVYRSSTSHLDYRRLAEIPATETTFTDQNVAEGVAWYYVVTAVNAAGLESNYSREVAVEPLWASFGPAATAAFFRTGGGR